MVELAGTGGKGDLLPEAKRVDTWATKGDRPATEKIDEPFAVDRAPCSIGCDSACMRPPMAAEWRISPLLFVSSAKSYRSASFSGGSGEW